MNGSPAPGSAAHPDGHEPMAPAAPLPDPPPALRILNPNFIKLFVGVNCFMTSMSMFNLLPYYLELRGASPDRYGLVAGAMGVSNFVFLVLFGRHADRWSRKFTVSVYMTAAFAGNLAAIWAMHSALEWYIVVRALHGLYMGLGFPLVFAWAVETGPHPQRFVVLSWMGIAGIFANSMGPTLAEFVLSAQPNPRDPDAFLGVFLLALAFQVAAWLVFFTVDDRRPAPVASGAGGLWPLLRRPESALLLAVDFAFGGLFGSLMSFGKNYAASLALDHVSLLLWAYSAGAIASRVFIRRISSRIPEQHLAPLGLAGLAVAFMTLGLARGYGMLICAGLLYGFSHGILYPTLYVRFIDYQEPDQGGRASTLYQGSFSVGWGFFPLVGGMLIHAAGFTAYFSLLGAVAGAGILVYLLGERSRAQRRTPAGG